MAGVPEQAELDMNPDVEPGLHSEPESDSGSEPSPEPDPLAVMQAKLDEEREARIRLEGEVRARNAAPLPAPAAEPPPPKQFTRAELRTAVNNGQIDEDQMEEIWTTQTKDSIRRELVDAYQTHEKTRTVESRVTSDTQKYIAAFPGITQQGSDDWNRVKQEYDYLVSIGDPDNNTTQLKALRAALGSPERIPDRTAERRETTRGTNSPGGHGDRPVDIFNRIPQKYRSYYKDRYENGQIDLATIEKDLPYMKRMS